MSKGSWKRPMDQRKYNDNWDRIFGTDQVESTLEGSPGQELLECETLTTDQAVLQIAEGLDDCTVAELQQMVRILRGDDTIIVTDE